ncbi:MAG: hypothetical protein QOK03_2306 [Candidatus Binataceae bacterium]|jgi:hypothetical protein|nr:hypothetical protein [Candidatus Binataceae bacterium]
MPFALAGIAVVTVNIIARVQPHISYKEKELTWRTSGISVT